jgi:dTDP-4-dehydrorhamnose reductase
LKFLVAGCNGLLGQNLLRSGAGQPGTDLTGLGQEPRAALPELLSGYCRADLGDRKALLAAVAETRPDFILNAAAITDVDGCERDPERCDRINRDAVGWLAETGIPLLHVSTDYVFDGAAGPYSEGDPTRPLSRYGRAKLESETLALSGSSHSVVVRTMLLWGLGQGAKKSFTDFVRETLAAGKPVYAVTDQRGNPTLAWDLALAAWALIRGGHGGIYHVAGADCMSRHEWALAVARFYGFDPSGIHPVLTAELRQIAARPLNSGLRSDKLGREIGFVPRGLQAQLVWHREALLGGS